MDITWYGQSCFRISERGKVAVVTDPFGDGIGLPAPKLKADVVTISHDAPGHAALEAIKSQPYVLRGPGEYEIGGVFITGVTLYEGSAADLIARPNVSYLLDYDSLTVLHLGDLAHVPDQSVIEELGQVNILLVPVGGGAALKAAQAAEVVALIEPNFIVPMHYELPGLALALEPVDKFLKAMGVSKVQEADVLKVSGADLPEQPQVVVLSPQGS